MNHSKSGNGAVQLVSNPSNRAYQRKHAMWNETGCLGPPHWLSLLQREGCRTLWAKINNLFTSYS